MTPRELVVSRLEAHGCRRTGGVWTCPGHDDSRPSLSVSEGRDGRALVKCHAGCSPASILSALGLEVGDLFPRDRERPAPRRLVRTYPYRDERGELLFEVLRFEPKAFQQRRPAPGGGWAFGLSAGVYRRGKRGDWIRSEDGAAAGEVLELPEARRVLYRLPEVLEAVRVGSTVYVVEGEKDAEALAALGLAGTTSPQGAGKWRAEFAEALRGARVRIIPDADEPGQRHAATVAAALAGVAASVEVLRLPAGKDASEFLERQRAAGSDDAAQRAALEALRAEAGPGDRPQTERAPAVLSPQRERLPLRRAVPEPEPFPVEALPPALRGAVECIARTVQVPPALAAQSALAAAALMAQARADVSLPFHGGASVPLSLFLLTVAESGDRKTTADRAACEAVDRRERELREESRDDLRAARDAHDTWEAQRRRILAERRLSSEAKAAQLHELGPEPELPPQPMLRVSEPTLEGLYRLFAEGLPSLALFAGEGGQFIGGHAMNAENRLKTSAGLSELWEGAPIRRTRAGETATVLLRRRVSVHLLLQPGVVGGLVGDAGLWNQGLLSRFLPVWPRSLAGGRFWRDEAGPTRAPLERFSARLLEGLRLRLPEDWRREGLRLPALKLEPAGVEILRSFYNTAEENVREGGDLAPVRGLANKAAEHAARLAGVLALTEDPDARAVDRAAVAAGCTLARHYLAEALRLRAEAEDSPEVLRAERLEAWLAGRPEGRAGLREILNAGPAGVRSKATARATLRLLESHGRAECIGAGEAGGTRAREVWRVIPEVPKAGER